MLVRFMICEIGTSFGSLVVHFGISGLAFIRCVSQWISLVDVPRCILTSEFMIVASLFRYYGSLIEIVGHDDISPGRKFDPGPAWDMVAFRERVRAEALLPTS